MAASGKICNIRLIRVDTGGFYVSVEQGIKYQRLTEIIEVGPVPYAEAKSVFDELCQEKTYAGYVAQKSGWEYTQFQLWDKSLVPQSTPVNRQVGPNSIYRPQVCRKPNGLKSPIGYIDNLLDTANWILQEKQTGGTRFILEVSAGSVQAHLENTGEQKPPLALIAKFAALPDCVLDGMLIGDQYVAWDILRTKTKDWRQYPLSERLSELDVLLFSYGHIVTGLPIIRGSQAKREVYAELNAAGKKAVFKYLPSAYDSENIQGADRSTWLEV